MARSRRSASFTASYMHLTYALVLSFTYYGVVNAETEDLWDSYSDGAWGPMTHYKEHTELWTSDREIYRPEGHLEFDPVITTTIKKLQNPSPFPDKSDLIHTAAVVELILTRGDGKEEHILDAFQFPKLTNKEVAHENTRQFLTPLYTNIRYGKVSAGLVEVGIFSAMKTVKEPYGICELYNYTIPAEPTGKVERDGERINCEKWNQFHASSSTYSLNPVLKDDRVIRRPDKDTGAAKDTAPAKDDLWRPDLDGVYPPISKYERYEERWTSDPETYRLMGDGGWSLELNTTVKLLKNPDPSPDNSNLFRTAAVIAVTLKRGDDKTTHVLDAFPFANVKNVEGVQQKTPEFLTPLYTNIRYGAITMDTVEVGVLTGYKKPATFPGICELYTYTIPLPTDAEGKAKKEVKGLDCFIWKKGGFLASSPNFSLDPIMYTV